MFYLLSLHEIMTLETLTVLDTKIELNFLFEMNYNCEVIENSALSLVFSLLLLLSANKTVEGSNPAVSFIIAVFPACLGRSRAGETVSVCLKMKQELI